MSNRLILLFLILYNYCAYDLDNSVIKKYLSQEHINQTEFTDNFQNNDIETKIDQFCNMSHDQYSQKLTLKTYQGYQFKAKTEDQVKIIASYFDFSYARHMNKIVSRIDVDSGNDTSVFLTQSYQTQNIVLINNDTDADHAILGVLAPYQSENDAIRMQAFYKVNTSSFKMNEFWGLNFTINDENATCYFCNDDTLFSGKNCEVKGEFSRIGEIVTANISSYSIKSDELKAKTSEIILIRDNLSPFISLQSLFFFLHTCLKHLAYIAGWIWTYKYKPKLNSTYSLFCFQSAVVVLLLVHQETLNVNLEILRLIYNKPILFIDQSTTSFTVKLVILDIFSVYCYGLVYVLLTCIGCCERFRKGLAIKKHCFVYIVTYSMFFNLLAYSSGYKQYCIFSKIWIHPNRCLLLLSNIYLFPIVANIVFRSRCAFIHPTCIILISVYFVCYPFTIYGYSEIIDGFTLIWVTKFMTCSIIHAVILYMQMNYGSRFFMCKWRERAYDKYMFSLLELTDYRYSYCDVCLNNLDEEEMEYSDLDTNYNYKTYQRHIFIKLDCGHVFHPNCLFRRIKNHQKCPQCDVELPEDDYLD